MGEKKKKTSAGSTVVTKSKSSQQGGSSFLNFLKWILVIGVIGGGVACNIHFTSTPWALRATGGIFVFILALAIAYSTTQGAVAWGFVKLAKTELRKVVWPTRPEVVQTTLMVVVMVLITAVVLWGIDTLFLWGVGWLVGQRG